jgi:hypothetical protein
MVNKKSTILCCLLSVVCYFFFTTIYSKSAVPLVSAQTPLSSWYMAGANAQRTSWVAEQVPATDNGWGDLILHPQWYSPIEGYIPHKVQIIAGNNTIFVSSANGVYAFDAANGTLKWVFPTELPIGQSPTYFETSFNPYPKRLYIPGMDHKLYCVNADPTLSSLPIDAATTQKINNQKCWPNNFEAGAGFETNPLVANVGGKVMIFAGNRDMNEYALVDNGTSYSVAWTYKAQAPILFSSALSKDTSRVYFATLDNATYAINTSNGTLVSGWGQKMQGNGFYSYWPVVYNDPGSGKEYVIFSGSNQYRPGVPPGENGSNTELNAWDLATFGKGLTEGTLVAPRGSDGLLDISKDYTGNNASGLGLNGYLENNPEHHTVFIVDTTTGSEAAFNINGNAKPDFAPFVWFGTQSGNRFPMVISGASGQGSIIYGANAYSYLDGIINRGGLAGWKFGTQYMSTPEKFGYLHAPDEPMYFAGGGNVIYWAMHQNTAAGANDVVKPFSTAEDYRSATWWADGTCSDWPCLHPLIANYDSASNGYNFGGANGNYGRNGDGNPPIPYKSTADNIGRVYFQEGNALIAFGTADKGQITSPVQTAKIVKASNGQPSTTYDQLIQKLADEVKKIVDTNKHLRPGFVN